MNKENAQEFLPLVQALAHGKTLQIDGLAGWVDLSEEINFEFDPKDYRIKPELRTFDIWINEKTKRVISVEDGDHDDNNLFSDWERITVMEVVK